MAHTNTLLSQLLKLVPKQRFKAAVQRRNSDKGCRHFFSWDLFVSLFFAQLTQAQSLRSLVDIMQDQRARLYHAGINMPKKSTLSDAQNKRSIFPFYDLFFDLLSQLGKAHSELKQSVMLMDSTVISLCQSQYQWAHFRTGKAGIKIHTLFDPDLDSPIFFQVTDAKTSDSKGVQPWRVHEGSTYVFDRAYNGADHLRKIVDGKAYFVGRMKTNIKYKSITIRAVVDEGVLKDELIKLDLKTNKVMNDERLRRIVYVRPEDGKTLVFFTNDLKRGAAEIAFLYKRRWQIELFFKWIKQNLKTKRFFGTTENAVMLQVIVAMITYVLLRLLHQCSQTGLSMLQLTRRIGAGIMQRRCLEGLLKNDQTPPPDPGIFELELGIGN